MAASPNKDRYRRYSGGQWSGQRGGLNIGSILQNLGTSGDTVSENQPASTSAIYGDEGGKFLDNKGGATTNKFSDARSWIAKALGSPNNAEMMNSELMMDRASLPGELNRLRQTGQAETDVQATRKTTLGPIEAYNTALNTVATRFGVTPDAAKSLLPLLAESAGGTVQGDIERNKTAIGAEQAARGGRVATAGNTADFAALSSGNLLQTAKNNPRFLDASSVAELLMDPARLQGMTDVRLSPEETLYRAGEVPQLRNIFGAGTARGSTITQEPQFINIGGQQIPTGHTTRKVTPPSSNIRVPFDPSVVGGAGGEGEGGTIPLDAATFGGNRRMPGRSSGVRKSSDLPQEMLGAKPDQNLEMMQRLRLILQDIYR